ncbi:MAG: NAD(P)/FAD-dependent oxidoreductase [Myxococcota bacterium]|nr:NAD(P)/FAD-dependent oxidoreductase [Myxococcota bacterium]
MGGRTLGSAFDWDLLIAGAGVVGLACAARLSAAGRRVLVVERHEGICREGSSRNSEVVHAGLYYPEGSLKARTCVAGRHSLYNRCRRLGIPARATGKLIVATEPGEVPELEELLERGTRNGVEGLQLLEGADLNKREPEVAGLAALWSPQSGIVDSHAFARSFQAEAEGKGATLAFRTEITGVEPLRDGYRLRMESRSEAGEFTTTSRQVVNAAGLGQPLVSQALGLDLDETGYRQHLCKGDWFTVAHRHRGRLTSLIYPVGRATDGGLGLHSCMDLGGGLRLGPDAEWIAGFPEELLVDPSKRRAFWQAGRRLFPWLEEADLSPDQAGLRPKLTDQDGVFSDFVVAEEGARGFPGWVTLAGIESPGLTAAPQLAEEVAALLERPT